MQTAAHTRIETPAAGSRPASLPSTGLLALEGRTVHRGQLRGAPVAAEGDLIFTTAATGWGEILTDPSYAGQIVVLTHPMAGSYRIDPAELESTRVHARGLVVSRLVTPPRGPGRSLEELLIEAGVPAIAGVDTRAITLELRRGAARRAVIRDGEHSDRAAVAAARQSPTWDSVDHVAAVATARAFTVPAPGARRIRAVLVDFGVKRSLLAALAERGIELRVMPHDVTAELVAAEAPELVVLSPGPGDPARMHAQITTVRRLAEAAIGGGPPILGVCLGHQLLALAAGARTARLPVGHHGGNHAVLEIASRRVDIGAHNHEVAVLDEPALSSAGYAVSHRDLNDGTVEGLRHRSSRIASVQFHPEGAPGPIDAARVFDAALEGASA